MMEKSQESDLSFELTSERFILILKILYLYFSINYLTGEEAAYQLKEMIESINTPLLTSFKLYLRYVWYLIILEYYPAMFFMPACRILLIS